jgi:hypothetical protein
LCKLIHLDTQLLNSADPAAWAAVPSFEGSKVKPTSLCLAVEKCERRRQPGQERAAATSDVGGVATFPETRELSARRPGQRWIVLAVSHMTSKAFLRLSAGHSEQASDPVGSVNSGLLSICPVAPCYVPWEITNGRQHTCAPRSRLSWWALSACSRQSTSLERPARPSSLTLRACRCSCRRCHTKQHVA